MAVSSYGSATQTSAVVRLSRTSTARSRAGDVLIIETIIDSGLTLNYLLKNLRSRRPATSRCAPSLKPEQFKADVR